MTRKLTKKFKSYRLDAYAKETGRDLMDLMDIGNFELGKIADFVGLGNEETLTREQVFDIIDDYLSSSDEHSIISLYFDLLKEYDYDIKLLKHSGVDIDELKNELMNTVKVRGNKLKDKLSTTNEDNNTEDGVGDSNIVPINKELNLSTTEAEQP